MRVRPPSQLDQTDAIAFRPLTRGVQLDEIDELLKKEDPSHAELRRVVAAEPLCKKMRAEYAEAVKVTHEMKSDEGACRTDIPCTIST